MHDAPLLARISVNPKIFGGKPIVRGLRIKVETVLALLKQGVPEVDMLDDYPDLEPEDIRACLAYSRALVANETMDAVSTISGCVIPDSDSDLYPACASRTPQTHTLGLLDTRLRKG